MSASQEQIAANRANAQHSTGPATDQGKATASQNALRHGLTGKTVVLPTENQNEFDRFCADIIATLEPGNPVEFEFAQIVANSQWRLKRVKAIEDGMLAFGPFGPVDPNTAILDPEQSELAARCFMEHRKAFTNLSQYESRLYRTMTNALKQLKDLQAARHKTEEEIESKAHRKFISWQYESGNFGGSDDDSADASDAQEETKPAHPLNEKPEIGFVFPSAQTAEKSSPKELAA